jgi:hypothetical protein
MVQRPDLRAVLCIHRSTMVEFAAKARNRALPSAQRLSDLGVSNQRRRFVDDRRGAFDQLITDAGVARAAAMREPVPVPSAAALAAVAVRMSPSVSKISPVLPARSSIITHRCATA